MSSLCGLLARTVKLDNAPRYGKISLSVFFPSPDDEATVGEKRIPPEFRSSGPAAGAQSLPIH